MMGFTGDSARLALERFTGDVQRAVEELLKCQGEVPPEWADLLGASSSGSSSSGRFMLCLTRAPGIRLQRYIKIEK